jgi:purine-cytosine permease-like protein
MNLSGMPDLALILFAPWFLILCALYWIYPRQPRNARRRAFDIVALLVALAAFIATLHWAHGYADRQYGTMWPQILATSAGYGVFLLVLVVAIFVRRAWLRKPM